MGAGFSRLPPFSFNPQTMLNIDLLFKGFYRPLCLYAVHYLQDINAAEDIVGDCFVSLLEHTKAGKQLDNPKSYLYTMVRNACLDRLRKENSFIADFSPTDLEGHISDEEAADRSFHEAKLWAAIDSLPDKCRQVFLMSKRDNMKYQEIAQGLGISEKTVEHHISKALKTLRGKEKDIFYCLSWMA